MNEEKVFNFIDTIDRERQDELADMRFKGSDTYKRRIIDSAKEDAANVCLSKIFEKFYIDAVPLNDDYKCAYHDGLCNDVHKFASDRTDGKSLSYYVGEAIKSGSVPAKRIMESVTKIVDEYYADKEENLESINTEDDLVFKMDDDTEKKLNVINRDLELDDLSQIISDNVRVTAASEIARAKAEKEKVREVERELSNNLAVNSESAIESELELRGMNKRKFYQPSLFEGVMINKMNSVTAESAASTYLYDTLENYGVTESTVDKFATPEEIAFVESVREYTLLNIAKSLKLESCFGNLSSIRELAMEYAQK